MGKSTVLQLFKKHGAYTFDIDKFVHDILKKQETIKKIARALGEEVLIKKSSGISLNKQRVAKIIFADPEKRKAIEKIIHPQVLKTVKETESKISKKNPSALIVFEVPLLFEAGYEKHFDKTVVVYCRRDLAISRLTRKGFSEDEALKRLRAQMAISRKRKFADFLVNNNGNVCDAEKQVERIYEQLTL